MHFDMATLAIALCGSEYPYGNWSRVIFSVAIVTLSTGVFSRKFELCFIMIELVIQPLFGIVTIFAVAVTYEFSRYLAAMNVGMAGNTCYRSLFKRPLLIGIVARLTRLRQMGTNQRETALLMLIQREKRG